MGVTMAANGIAPLIPMTAQTVQAAELDSVKSPTNVLVKKNTGESLTVDWSNNENSDGTEYYVVATPTDAKSTPTQLKHNLDGESFPADMDFKVDGWSPSSGYLPGKYYQSNLYEYGDNTIEFKTTIPETATSANVGMKLTARSNDVLSVHIDGVQVSARSGYGTTGTVSYPLTAGEHVIKIVYKNTGDTNYMGRSYVDDLSVSYTEKEHVNSGWVSGTAHTFEDLDPTRDYNVTIRAKNGTERTVLLPAKNATDITTSPVANGLDLNWSTALSGVASYEVLRNGESIYTGSEGSFNDINVLGLTEYRYLVKSFDANGAMIGAMYKDVTTTEYLELQATTHADGASLDWNYSKEETPVGNYEVYRDNVLVYTGTESAFFDENAMNGASYAYTLKVISPAGDLLETDTLSVKMPVNLPSDVVITNDGATAKTIQWNHNHNSEDTLYKAIATPVGATKQTITKVHDLNGKSFSSDMNLVVDGWVSARPYFYSTSSLARLYQPTKMGVNKIAFDAKIPLTATNAIFRMNYHSVTNDVMQVKVDGVIKWSKSGYDRGSETTRPSMSVALTPGENHRIEVIFNNTGDTNYGGTSFVDDLTVSYAHDGSVESEWTKDSEFNFEGLDATKKYNLTVSAKNQGVETEKSTARAATQLNVENVNGSVKADFEYLLPGASSYEVLRDGKVIHTGSEVSYVDTESLGDKTYAYTINVKDAEGKVIGTASKSITTPTYTSVTATNASGGVHLEMGYLKEEAVTYEVLRNGVAIYQGENDSFIDKSTTGATTYSYQVNVKDTEGVVIGTKTASIQTPIALPTNLQVEKTSPTSLKATWEDGNNPTNTQYMVQAVPVGQAPQEDVNLVEGFESATQVLSKTGAWARSTADKKAGSYSLKSATIAHRGTTTSTFNIDVPVSANDATLDFDYRVSSEANYDWFSATLNGVQIVRVSGNGTWQAIQKNLKPGNNVLTFTYTKDVSGNSNLDAAFVDNLKVSYASDGVKKSDWITAKEFEITGLPSDVEYDILVTAKANGLESAPVASGSNPVEEVETSLDNLTDALEDLDFTNREDIGNAQTQLDAIQELVDALPEGEVKDAIQTELDAIQQTITDALQLNEATEAVDSFIEALPEELVTQDAIDQAKTDLEEARELVNALPEGDVKDALLAELADATELIELAEKILVTKEAVSELTEAVASLDTQEKIDHANTMLKETMRVIALLPEGNTDRVELSEDVAVAIEAIELAQAELDVTKLAETLTQAGVDKARDSIEKVDVEAEKDALLEKVALAQQVLDTKALLEDIASRVISTPEEVDTAIAEMELTEAFISSLTDTFMSAEQANLEQTYRDAKWHVAEELMTLLKENKSGGGKKEKLTIDEEALDLLVQYTIQTSFLTNMKEKFGFLTDLFNPYVAEKFDDMHKGTIKGKLQALLNNAVTGKQLNDMIDKYLN